MDGTQRARGRWRVRCQCRAMNVATNLLTATAALDPPEPGLNPPLNGTATTSDAWGQRVV